MQYIFRLPLGMLFFKVRALALRPARGDAKCSIARHILCNIFSAYGKDFACVSLLQAFRLAPKSRKVFRLASTMGSGFYAIIVSVQASPAACLDVDGMIFPDNRIVMSQRTRPVCCGAQGQNCDRRRRLTNLKPARRRIWIRFSALAMATSRGR